MCHLWRPRLWGIKPPFVVQYCDTITMSPPSTHVLNQKFAIYLHSTHGRWYVNTYYSYLGKAGVGMSRWLGLSEESRARRKGEVTACNAHLRSFCLYIFRRRMVARSLMFWPPAPCTRSRRDRRRPQTIWKPSLIMVIASNTPTSSLRVGELSPRCKISTLSCTIPTKLLLLDATWYDKPDLISDPQYDCVW